MKKVNILLSTYNGESYLDKQLESLIAQTYSNITIYIRDDGSKDRTLEIIRKYKELVEQTGSTKKMILIESGKENLGYCKSFARICTLVPEADYYAFCDQDDVWRRDKIERAVMALNKENADELLLFSHSYHICNDNLNIVKTNVIYHPSLIESGNTVEFPKALMMGDWFGQGFTQVFNHTLMKIAFNKELELEVSHDVWTSWVLAGYDGKFIFDKEALVHYRRHIKATSIGSTGRFSIYRQRIRNFKKICIGINNALTIFNDEYGDSISRDNRDVLEMFMEHRQFKKITFGKRYREQVIDEVAFRILMLFNIL